MSNGIIIDIKDNKYVKLKKRRKIIKRLKITLIVVIFLFVLIGFFIGGKALYNIIFSTSISKTKKDPLTIKIENACKYAKQYDYDTAISRLKKIDDYKDNETILKKIKQIKKERSTCLPYPVSKIEHVFYHTLVVDPNRAFNQGTTEDAGWKQWMVTVSEFNKITKEMYDNGYVMVSLHDLVKEVKEADGTTSFVENDELMLPKGKKAFVLSLDDTCYYHSYEGRGTASKLIIKDGKVTNEYIDESGKTLYGSYDCIPLLNDFVKKHPDFSYKGRMGTIALTGYNGIFGYRTDIAYKTRENLDSMQASWLDNHPDFNFDKECKEAKKVAMAVKKDGWEIASHTWGHIKIGTTGYNYVVQDTQNWLNNVKPLVGETDTIIFAHGQDINQGKEYYQANDKFVYLRDQGFKYYCNVDSTDPYIYSIGKDYLRMGRMNLDGYRLWQDAKNGSNRLTNLFNAADVIDPIRVDMPAL